MEENKGYKVEEAIAGGKGKADHVEDFRAQIHIFILNEKGKQKRSVT